MEAGKIVRLMELFNVKIQKVTADSVEAEFLSESYEEIRKAKAQLIHWIPLGQEYPTAIIQQDATTVEGYSESACKNLKPSTIIQFERFGFVRTDMVETKLIAYYAHK
jgi:glutamyl-tRNA synthetase